MVTVAQVSDLLIGVLSILISMKIYIAFPNHSISVLDMFDDNKIWNGHFNQYIVLV